VAAVEVAVADCYSCHTRHVSLTRQFSLGATSAAVSCRASQGVTLTVEAGSPGCCAQRQQTKLVSRNTCKDGLRFVYSGCNVSANIHLNPCAIPVSTYVDTLSRHQPPTPHPHASYHPLPIPLQSPSAFLCQGHRSLPRPPPPPGGGPPQPSNAS
jgi:hypothetical protein